MSLFTKINKKLISAKSSLSQQNIDLREILNIGYGQAVKRVAKNIFGRYFVYPLYHM